MLGVNVAWAQCMERDSLRNQLAYLRETSTLSDRQKLTVLLDYLSGLKACTYRDDSIQCSLLSAIALLYQKESDHLKAINYYKQAIDLAGPKSNNAAVPANNLVEYYCYMSDSYDSLNKTPERLACLDSGIAIGIRSPIMSRLCLWCIWAKVLYYFDVGDYRRCSEYASICEKFGKQYARSPAERIAYGGIIYAAISLQWNVNALIQLRRFDDAETLLSSKMPEYRKVADANSVGLLYDQLGQVLAHNKKYDKALFYFREAYSVERAAGNSIMCKTILNNIGYFVYYLDDRNIDSSLIYYHRALQVKTDTISPRKFYPSLSIRELDAMETLNVLGSTADAFIRKGSFESAYKYIQLAFDQIGPGLNEQKIIRWSQGELGKLIRIRYITALFMSKGTAYHECYKQTGNIAALREALRIYKLTDQLLDRIKATQFDNESKLFWRGDSRRLYEQAIQASFCLNDVDNAFYFFEKSRAVLLNDQLKEQRWVGDNDIVKQNQLRSRINFLQKEIGANDINDVRLDGMQKELFSTRQELDGLVQAIKIKNPLYYQNFIDSTMITSAVVRDQILKDHEALIEIYSGDSAVYELVATKQKNYWRTINKQDFDELSERYLSYLSDGAAGNIHFKEFAKVSAQLYRLLFQDVDLRKGRIFISPDGHYFPFEALVTSFENGKARYFVNDFAVTYIYSARYLINDFARQNNDESRTIIGFAPVTFADKNLGGLAGSDVSLKKIASYFTGSEFLLSDNASKKNFLQKFHAYQLIQLYTHATDSGYNGEPVIWFADSTLTLSDLISDYKPATRLVVLSACETAKGKLYRGEGVFSFNRGFAALGIPSSVSSLWPIENQSAYRITELFYKYLRDGMPSDVALQKAKLDFISGSDKEKQIPYYWAPSILVGIDESFVPGHNKNWNILLVIASLMVVALAIALVMRERLRHRDQG
jgi:CHAT domain-containing protein